MGGGDGRRRMSVTVVGKLRGMKLGQAATIVEAGVEETLSYMAFPREHWTRIRMNNILKRIVGVIRRRTRVVGAFIDGRLASMAVAARPRHVAGTRHGHPPLDGHGTIARVGTGGTGGKVRTIAATVLPPRASRRGRRAPRTPKPAQTQFAQRDRRYYFAVLDTGAFCAETRKRLVELARNAPSKPQESHPERQGPAAIPRGHVLCVVADTREINQMKVTKAVITAAGPTQRRLPLQRFVDLDGSEKAALKIIIEELVAASVERVAVVVCRGDKEP